MSEVSLHPLNRLTTLTNRDDQALVVVGSGQGSTADATETRTALGLGDASTYDAADLPVSTATQTELDATKQLVSLHDYRTAIAAGAANSILFIGDSMIGTAESELREACRSRFGLRGHGTLPAGTSGDVTTNATDCAHWVSGITYSVGTAGILTFSENGTTAVEGDTFKIYYVTEPGGGTFKVQSQEEGGSWTDEPGYTAVDCDATLAGNVITITKSTYQRRWKIRVVGVSGSSRIIGGGIQDSKQGGLLLTILPNSSNGSNNIDDALATPSAILDPIIRDLAPNLIVLSHYDGATITNSSQAAYQDALIAACESSSGRTPSFVIVGPPPGYDAASDVQPAAQQIAQQALALSRGDAFFDNRTWALPISKALDLGLMVDADVHYQTPAIKQWVPAMFSWLGLENTNRSRLLKNGIEFPMGANDPVGPLLRFDPNAWNTGFPGIQALGAFRLSKNLATGGTPRLILEDRDGPVDNGDVAEIFFKTNKLQFSVSGPSNLIVFSYNGFVWDASTASTPVGDIGTTTDPIRSISIGKTITAGGTTGSQTINKSSGSVNFAAAATSLVVTNNLVSTSSVILATVATNDATMTSVQAVAGNGSFTLHANVAATAETRVNFIVFN